MARAGWSEFGQHVTLTARIREILDNYPEGTSVLKELIQALFPPPSPFNFDNDVHAAFPNVQNKTSTIHNIANQRRTLRHDTSHFTET